MALPIVSGGLFGFPPGLVRLIADLEKNGIGVKYGAQLEANSSTMASKLKKIWLSLTKTMFHR
jgi:hypothetical protein